MFDQFLNALLNSCDDALLSVLLFIFNLFILLFYHSILLSLLLVLIASGDLLCVVILASFMVLCHVAAYFGHFFLYLISFLSKPFIRCCIAQSEFMHVLYSMFYAAFICSYWI